MVSVQTTPLSHCNTEAAIANTYTSERGCVSVKLIINIQASSGFGPFIDFCSKFSAHLSQVLLSSILTWLLIPYHFMSTWKFLRRLFLYFKPFSFVSHEE